MAKCNSCGKKISWFSHGGLCEECHRNSVAELIKEPGEDKLPKTPKSYPPDLKDPRVAKVREKQALKIGIGNVDADMPSSNGTIIDIGPLDLSKGPVLFFDPKNPKPIRYPDGSTYRGEVDAGLSATEGSWINPHGKGTMTYADGSKYEGSWRHGKKHGKGTMTYADGTKHEGEWFHDALVDK